MKIKEKNLKMKSIKNFIYLDDYKMYSISSQIFEGMTEYIIKGGSEKKEEQNQQKGKYASGRVMADIVETQSGKTEKIFLHDYSYTLFETKLIEDQKVIILDATNSNEIFNKKESLNFIKVTGQILLNDTKSIENILTNFNTLGLNATIVQGGAETQDGIQELKNSVNKIKDRNQKSKSNSIVDSRITSLKALAKEKGMQLDETYLNALKYLLNFGYQQQFEIQLPIINDIQTYFFSAILKREKLKEFEDILVKKYSRLTEKKFTIFGILTQTKDNNVKEIFNSIHAHNPDSVKAGILEMINKLSVLENIFAGRQSNEYIIDPIAIYQEL